MRGASTEFVVQVYAPSKMHKSADTWRRALSGAWSRGHGMLLHVLQCFIPAAAAAMLSIFASIALAARTQMHVQKELEVLEIYESLFA